MEIFNITLFGIHIAPKYYGLMYGLGLIIGYIIIKNRNIIKSSLLDNLLLYIIGGVILGGRLGYVLFYNFSYFLEHPLHILNTWEGGMSFHGGIIGVVIAMILFTKIYKINFYKLADQIALVVPIGLGLGRIGNYLNKELLGFSNYYGPLNINGRFPSPLIEMFLEGIVLFIILNYIYIKNVKKVALVPGKGLKNGQIASLFLIFYGLFRIFVEAFFRMPDSFIGYIWGYFTLGELYSLPMIMIGIYFYIKLGKNKKN